MEKSFEMLMAELETAVKQMESGELPLDELVKKYEEAAKIQKACRARLDEFTKKIELLTSDDGKNGSWTDFEPDNTRVRTADDSLFPEN